MTESQHDLEELARRSPEHKADYAVAAAQINRELVQLVRYAEKIGRRLNDQAGGGELVVQELLGAHIPRAMLIAVDTALDANVNKKQIITVFAHVLMAVVLDMDSKSLRDIIESSRGPTWESMETISKVLGVGVGS